MAPRSSTLSIPLWITAAAILGILLLASLQGCTPATEALPTKSATFSTTAQPTSTVGPSTPTARPTQTPTRTAAPTATHTPTYTRLVPTPFPTSLEAFGMHYDPNTALDLPPWGSISMLFWGSGIPVTPVQSTTAFIPYSTPQSQPHSENLLIQAGCQVVDRWGNTACSPDSPLLSFECSYIVDPQGIGSGLDPQAPLVAVCKKYTEEHEAAKAGGVYLVGCAFKFEIHSIFKDDDEYLMVSGLNELRDLLAPIDTPEEAVSYAQMATGLEAVYDFSYDPTLMYFHEIIAGTHATQDGSTFEMNLFNFAGCGCEPWITTQIDIRVDRSGEVTWGDAVPVFMTTGWGCAD